VAYVNTNVFGGGTGQAGSTYEQAKANEATKANSGTDWLDWARMAYGVYQDNRAPKTKNIPLSPEMKKLYDAYYANVMNPATRDNAAKVNQAGWEQVNRLAGAGGWTSPKTFSGQTGYSGTGAAPTLSRPIQSGPIAPPAPTGAAGSNGIRAEQSGTMGVRPGVKDRDVVGGLDGIPGARMPEDDYQRNVGLPGFTTSTAPTGLHPGNVTPPGYGTTGGGMEYGQLPPAIIDLGRSIWENKGTIWDVVKGIAGAMGIPLNQAEALVRGSIRLLTGGNNQPQGGSTQPIDWNSVGGGQVSGSIGGGNWDDFNGGVTNAINGGRK
jgi:hypothetical protein